MSPFLNSLAAALIGAAVWAQNPGPASPAEIRVLPGDREPYLRDYDAPATRIRAGFVPRKAESVRGEPLQATFWVQNLGPGPFEFFFGGDYRGTGRHDRFKIMVTDAAGKSLPDPRTNSFNFGGFVQPVKLTSGQSFSNVINLTDFRVIEPPGVYQVDCSFAFDERLPSTNVATNLVVHTSFALTLLERTSPRVNQVLDELAAKAQAAKGNELAETLALMARFGQEEAIPLLARFAAPGAAPERRVAALGALALIPTEASLDAVVKGLVDADPAVRAGAAGALGTMGTSRAVEAMLTALPGEKTPVAEAILLALGTSKSDRAWPVLTNTLAAQTLEMRRATVQALAIFGGPRVIEVLKQHVDTSDLPLRYEIVLALAEKLHQPLSPDWLLPVLMGRNQSHEWLDSLRLLRLYAGDQAIPAMLSCLDFDVAWSGRNWWILNEVRACPKAPPADYEHDYNSDGTPEQWQKNLRTLQALKPLAGPVPISVLRPKTPAVPLLQTDPPIDFTATLKSVDSRSVQISSGFLTLTKNRNGGNHSYQVSEPYLPIYQLASKVRSLLGRRELYPSLEVTSVQAKQLDESLDQFAQKLCGPQISDRKVADYRRLLVTYSGSCPSELDLMSFFFAYREAPAGPLKEQAEADLCDVVRAYSQNYHAGTVEFAAAAKLILTRQQLERIP
jgi:HEAT repeat protein